MRLKNGVKTFFIYCFKNTLYINRIVGLFEEPKFELI